MAIAYNSLLNKDWYSRMLDRIKTGISSNIRRTGSEVDDPYWKAREAQGIGDLNAARMDEFRRLQERALVARANAQGREKARQQMISAAMGRYITPSQYLGGPGYEAQDYQEAQMPGFPATSGGTGAFPAPPATVPYRVPLSETGGKPQVGGIGQHRIKSSPFIAGLDPAYNPSKYENYELAKRKKQLAAYYALLANKPGKIAVY